MISKSGRTVYFGDKALHRGNGVCDDFDIENGHEYWVSGIKKRGSNRHWAGGGVVGIEASAVAEFLRHTGQGEVDLRHFKVVPDLPAPDPDRFVAVQNRKLGADSHKKSRT
jgi:hypothetical protein